jgi:hypothetical protein
MTRAWRYIAVTAIIAVGLRGEYEEFVVSTDTAGLGLPYGGHFVMRDGTPAPLGLKVQKCHSGPRGLNAYAAPTTAVVFDTGPVSYMTNILGNALPADCMDYEAGRTWMGDDDSSAGPLNDVGKPGFVAGGIYCPDASRIGWLRAFSADRIRRAAYYGDARMGATALDEPGQINVLARSDDAVIASVNLAYEIVLLEGPETDGEIVRGRVDACAGGDANRLPSEWIVIEYCIAGNEGWTVLDGHLSADGEFQGLYPATSWPVSLRARVCDTQTPRPGLPVSPSYHLEPDIYEHPHE